MSICRKNLPIRVLEFVLCAICLVLAIFIFLKSSVAIPISIVLLTVSTAFLFITGIDIISWICRRPIGFMTWIMVATAGFLMFCLCTGLVVALMLEKVTALAAAAFIFSLITAIVFLFELFYMIRRNKVLDPYWRVGPSAIKQDERRETVDKAQSAAILLHDDIPVVGRRDEEIDATRPIMYKYCVSCGEGRKFPRQPSRTRQIPTSYGGTFSVSKDATPLHPGDVYCPAVKTAPRHHHRNIYVESFTTTRANLGVGSQTVCTDDIVTTEMHRAKIKKMQVVRRRNHTCPCSPLAGSARITRSPRSPTMKEISEKNETAIDETLDREVASQGPGQCAKSSHDSAVVIFEAADKKNNLVQARSPQNVAAPRKIVAEVITEDGKLKTCGLKRSLFSMPGSMLPGQTDCTYRMKCVEDCRRDEPNEIEIVIPEREDAKIMPKSVSQPVEGTAGGEEKMKYRSVAVTARTVKKTDDSEMTS